jgi:hypothetical protein
VHVGESGGDFLSDTVDCDVFEGKKPHFVAFLDILCIGSAWREFDIFEVVEKTFLLKAR